MEPDDEAFLAGQAQQEEESDNGVAHATSCASLPPI